MLVPATSRRHRAALRWARRIIVFLSLCYLFAVLLNATIIFTMLADTRGVFPDDLCEQLGTREPVPQGLLDTRPLGWSCGLRLEVLPAFLFLVPLFFLPVVLPLIGGVALVGRHFNRRGSRPCDAEPASVAWMRRALRTLAICYLLSFLVNLLVLLAPPPNAACDASEKAEALFGFLGVIYLGVSCEMYWGDPLGPLDPIYLLFVRPIYFAPIFVPAGYLLFRAGRWLLRFRARQSKRRAPGASAPASSGPGDDRRG